ncbi:CipC-like protein [Mycena haematopus]|nr:CipC-like protein [Mycena haematopus]
MGWFSHDSDEAQAAEQVQSGHKSSITHELLASAAAYEAAKAYEKHVAENGKPESHAKAKEILAALTAGFIDREVETKGLDFIDTEKAKHDARKQNEENLANDY